MSLELSDRLSGGVWEKIRKMFLEARGEKTVVMIKSLVILLPGVTWKTENLANKLDELAKDISRQRDERAIWLILAAYGENEETWVKSRTVQFSNKI